MAVRVLPKPALAKTPSGRRRPPRKEGQKEGLAAKNSPAEDAGGRDTPGPAKNGRPKTPGGFCKTVKARRKEEQSPRRLPPRRSAPRTATRKPRRRASQSKARTRHGGKRGGAGEKRRGTRGDRFRHEGPRAPGTTAPDPQ